MKIQWEKKYSHIMEKKIINGTLWAVVIFIDPYNSLYHLNMFWNSLYFECLWKRDVSLWFF